MANWKTILQYTAILLLAVGLALGSRGFVRPASCLTLCTEPLQAPCLEGVCRFGEQRAGFPLPFLIDNEAGSPLDGWGKVGPEDMPNPLFFAVDVLFYGLLLWLFLSAARNIRRRSGKQTWAGLALPAGGVFIILVVGIGVYLPHPEVRTLVSLGPRSDILGSWRATDAATGQEFIFRFFDSGRVTMTPPGSDEQISGEYRWTTTNVLQLSFSTMEPQSSVDNGLCRFAASFLHSVCHIKVANPAEYPAPIEESASAYPVPTPEPIVFNSINEEFQIAVDRDRFTLGLPAGEKQEFTRIVKALGTP